MTAAFEEALDRGVERFNRGEFWDAHEEWESIWLHERGERRAFLQGLIQLAAAWYHVQRGNIRGALRLFDAAMGRLDPYPDPHCGIEREAAVKAAAAARGQLSLGTTPAIDLSTMCLVRYGELGRDFRKSET